MQPTDGSLHKRTFIGMLGGIASIKMSGLGSIFKSEEKNSMEAEALEEYALDSA